MIKIDKPTSVPKKLKNKGAEETKINCTAFDTNRSKFLKDLKIHSKIYGHKTVKKVLRDIQHNKCCFCEKHQGDEYGAVEHFRPKMSYKLAKDKISNKPGYYWLAYDWDNLFFVCNVCNSSYKSDLFPLVDEKKRATNHSANVNDESPFLINPGSENNIETHLDFKDAQIIGLTERGNMTIKICGLDRDALNEKRAKHINDIKARIIILSQENKQPLTIVEEARKYIRNCMSPAGEFSAMVNSYLRQHNIVLIS
jgi:hypothetical protein